MNHHSCRHFLSIVTCLIMVFLVSWKYQFLKVIIIVITYVSAIKNAHMSSSLTDAFKVMFFSLFIQIHSFIHIHTIGIDESALDIKNYLKSLMKPIVFLVPILILLNI